MPESLVLLKTSVQDTVHKLVTVLTLRSFNVNAFRFEYRLACLVSSGKHESVGHRPFRRGRGASEDSLRTVARPPTCGSGPAGAEFRSDTFSTLMTISGTIGSSCLLSSATSTLSTGFLDNASALEIVNPGLATTRYLKVDNINDHLASLPLSCLCCRIHRSAA